MRILVNYERSGIVREAFAALGHDVWSCDLEDTDQPGQHIKGDAVEAAYDAGPWDLMIAHPVCRYLANSGSKHLYVGMAKKKWAEYETMEKKMIEATQSFKLMLNAPIDRICVENPIIHCHAKALIGRGQNQVLQPWMFGYEEMKATCLWLKNLPLLMPTDVVGPPPKDLEERRTWAKVHMMPPGPDRQRLRSVTNQGIADAMANQWGR